MSDQFDGVLDMSSVASKGTKVELLPPGHAVYGQVYKVVLEPATTAPSQTGSGCDAAPEEPAAPVALLPPPAIGERVAIHYRAYVAASDTDLKGEPDSQGRILFDVCDSDVADAVAPFTFVLGRHQVIPVVELALFTMRVGEKALVCCRAPKYAYGDRGRKGRGGRWMVKPNCASIELEIHFLGTVRIVDGRPQLLALNGVTSLPWGPEAKALDGACQGGDAPNAPQSLSSGALETEANGSSASCGDGTTSPPTGSTAGTQSVTAPPLLRFRKTRAFADLETDADRMAYALEAKELGNYYFKGGQLEAAVQEYEVALQTLQLWGKAPSNQSGSSKTNEADDTGDLSIQTQREQLTRTLLSNLARTHYRLGAYHDAIRLADLVLESAQHGKSDKREEDRVAPAAEGAAAASESAHCSLVGKALFTRGQAQRELGNYEDAKRDLLQVLRLEPKHTIAKKELEQLQRLIEVHRKQEKRTFGGIFSSTARRAPTASHVTTFDGD